MLPQLLYLGLTSTHNSPFLELTADGRDCARHARRLLAEHLSCDKIEIWRDDACIAIVLRSDALA